MTAPTCANAGCARPCPDAFLCPDCTTRVRDDLRALGGWPGRHDRPGWPRRDEHGDRQPDRDHGLLAELEITMARLDVTDAQPAVAEEPDPDDDHHPTDEPIAEHRLPFHIGAAAVLRQARADLSTWVRHLVEVRYGQDLDGLACDAHYRARFATPRQLGRQGAAHGPWRRGPQLPDNTLPAMAAWLGRHTESIAADAGAAQLASDVARLAVAARRVIEPESLEFLGHCESCQDGQPPATIPLHVARGAHVGACPRCRSGFDVGARRDQLMASARGYVLTAAEASRALVEWARDLDPSRPLTAARIRGWAHRGKLDAADPLPDEASPRYQLGQIMDLATAAAKEGRNPQGCSTHR